MTARVVRVGKRNWLAGMSWCSFEDIPNKAELGEDAQRLKASWVALRQGESAIQGGFCAPVDGMKGPGKLFSLAAMVADSREQPWLGVFKIDEGLWWYVAVRDEHAILPDGDVIGGQEEIYAARERHSGFTDWNYIEGDLSLLEEFIDGIEAKPTRVKSLAGPNIQLGPLMAGTFALAVAVGGAGYWWSEQKAAQERARAAAIQRMRAELSGQAQPAQAMSPVQGLPAPDEWLMACKQVIAPLPLSQNGWVLDQVGCVANSVVVRWASQDGATVAGRPAGIVSVQGDAVEQTIPLKGLKGQSPNDTVALGDAKLTVRAWAQAAGFELAMDEAAPPAPLPGANAPQAAPAPGEVKFAMAMGGVSPFGLDMSALPGLRLTKIQSTDKGWRIEGTIYGR
jgi:hypothetical protein